jgi:hypothetical protein
MSVHCDGKKNFPRPEKDFSGLKAAEQVMTQLSLTCLLGKMVSGKGGSGTESGSVPEIKGCRFETKLPDQQTKTFGDQGGFWGVSVDEGEK